MSEIQQIDPAKAQAFTTNNLPLAIALAAAGCQFPSEDGKTIAGLNQYSLGFVRAQVDPITKRPRCEGMPHEKAIQFLWRMGVPGNVTSSFARSATLSAVCKGWADQEEATGASALRASEEEFGRIARALTKARVDFVGSKEVTPLWRRRDAEGNLFVPAIKLIEGHSTSERDGRKTTTTIRDARAHAVAV